MNAQIAKYIFTLGAKYRNPHLWSEYESLKDTEWSSLESLSNVQLMNTEKLLNFAGKYSPYYKNLFNKLGFSASKLSSIEDIRVLPIINKETLMKRNKEIHSDYTFNATFLAETSGTTGGGLEFTKDERWDSVNRALLMRSYDWYGVKPWDRHGYLWGYNISARNARKTRILDALQNRFRIFDYTSESIRYFAELLSSADYIAGYSSMIYEVAKIINSLGIKQKKLCMAKGTSEMIFDGYQDEVRRAFGTKLISEYGAAESGLIAFECPNGNMHINMENVIVELEEDGGIIVTNLSSYSFPIIRYRLGDAITLSNDCCDCGRSHSIIRNIVGRKGASIFGYRKQYPALTFYYVFKNIAVERSIVLNYKVIQEKKGEAKIYIEGLSNKKYESYVESELGKYFDDDVGFIVIFVSEFDVEKKKFQYFESLVED